MEKFKTLVLTRRTKPPTAIQKFIESASILEAHYADPAIETTAIVELLSKEKPTLVLIDGEYDTGARKDHAIWSRLALVGQKGLRMFLLEQEGFPASLTLMQLVHACADDTVKIFLFIDAPGDIVANELRRLGASKVWQSLNELGTFESSMHEFIHDTKAIGSSLKNLARSVRDSFKEY